jgi:hypothetical protein
MQEEQIPGDLREFINRYFDSIAQLEALLLLRRSPLETWTDEAVAKRLYTSVQQVTEVLDRLCDDGFLTCDEHVYCYAPVSNELRQQVDRLAELYNKQLIDVTNLIHSKSSRIRQFAQAFKIRKDR